MIEGIETYYQRIGESISEFMPEDWVTARINSVFYAGHRRYDGEYIDHQGGLHSLEVPRHAVDAFEELHELFTRSGTRIWCSAQFELQSDGQFKMGWGYDNCDENGFATFDEAEERKWRKEQNKRFGL